MEHPKETAILIFANSPEEELKHKPVLHGALLFDALTERTVRTVQATGIPYFHFTESEQTGNSFGERFVNAVTAIFDKGFSAVITLGNDSPQLKVSDIHKAHQLLLQDRFVLGPAADGGCYLMGLQKAHFYLLGMSAMPWQRGNLSRALLAKAGQLGLPFAPLRMLYDLDTEMDILQIGRHFHTIGKRIRSLIQRLFAEKKEGHERLVMGSYTRCHATFFNKGSPYLQPQS